MKYVPASSSELRKEDILGRKTNKTVNRDNIPGSPKFTNPQAARDYIETLRELTEEDPWLKKILWT